MEKDLARKAAEIDAQAMERLQAAAKVLTEVWNQFVAAVEQVVAELVEFIRAVAEAVPQRPSYPGSESGFPRHGRNRPQRGR
jgi:hypothetical protein